MKKKPFAALFGPVDSYVLYALPVLQKAMLTLMAAFCIWEKAICLASNVAQCRWTCSGT